MVSISSFDERAATWDDDPGKVASAARAAAAIRQALRLHRSTRLLEYGAGTGLVSQALGAAVGQVTLVDTSAGMRSVMEGKIAAGAITNARVWDVDLAVEPAPEEQFDLVVTVMALHHVSDRPAVLSKFAELLVDGGHVAIVDLEQEDGSFHGEGFAGPHGFDPVDLTAQLESAGFTDVGFERCDEVIRHGVPYPVFLATGRRTPR